jgi:hypothetical protein
MCGSCLSGVEFKSWQALRPRPKRVKVRVFSRAWGYVKPRLLSVSLAGRFDAVMSVLATVVLRDVKRERGAGQRP